MKYGGVEEMGTHWRSGSHYEEAVEMVQAGKLGKVRCWAYLDWITDIGNPVDGAAPEGVDYDMWLGPAPLRAFNANRFHFNFRWFWDYAGGLMTDWGVHLINLALWAMGPEWPKAVISSGGSACATTRNARTQITVLIFLRIRCVGAPGAVRAGGGPARHGDVTGSDATLILDQGWEICSLKAGVIEMKRMRRRRTIRGRDVRRISWSVKSRRAPVEISMSGIMCRRWRRRNVACGRKGGSVGCGTGRW